MTPGAIAFQDDVGVHGGLQHGGAPSFTAQIDFQDVAAAIDNGIGPAVAAGAIDAQHFRAEVGQQHGAMRPRPDAADLDDSQTRKRPARWRVSHAGRVSASG